MTPDQKCAQTLHVGSQGTTVTSPYPIPPNPGKEWLLNNVSAIPNGWASLFLYTRWGTRRFDNFAFDPADVDHLLSIPEGTRINFDPSASPGLADLPSPSPDIGGSSLALVPNQASQAGTGWNGFQRQTLGGVVDFVTGSPLIRVVDLELPFDSATFRLTRTRSGVNTGFTQSLDTPFEQDRWWDWTGQGWMIGENPLLVIDSALPDVVGPNARTTWLVLDAHTSIPFQQVVMAGGNIQYEAPPRFRARMTHDGVSGVVTDACGNSSYGWTTRPSFYRISLYDGLVTYTFAAVWENVPPYSFQTSECGSNQGAGFTASSFHDTPIYPTDLTHRSAAEMAMMPFQPGIGMPYLGLLTEIRDQSGHVVTLEYSDSGRQAVNPNDPNQCVPCLQDGPKFGQLGRVQLKTVRGTSETIAWTLLYAYRRVADDGENIDRVFYPYTPRFDETIASTTIDRIYVYRGNKAIPVGGIAELPMSDVTRDQAPDLAPADWVHRIRYQYAEDQMDASQDPPVPFDYSFTTHREVRGSPMLVRTQVRTRREENGTLQYDRETERNTFYRSSRKYVVAQTSGHDYVTVNAVFSNEDYDHLKQWGTAAASPAGSQDVLPTQAQRDWIRGLTPEKFAVADRVAISEACSEQKLGNDINWIRKFASIRLDSAGSPDGGFSETPSSECFDSSSVLTEYVKSVSPTGRALTYWDLDEYAVRKVSFRQANGQVVHARVFRMFVPDGIGSGGFCGAGHSGCGEAQGGTYEPTRSMYFHPFRWRLLGDQYRLPADDVPDLSKARWYMIVDQFATREDLDSTAEYSPFVSARAQASDYSIKPGQLSRRVVELNAAGYMLRDRTWDFTNEGVVHAGGGLGDTYEYALLEDLFPQAKLDMVSQVECPMDQPTCSDEWKAQQVIGFLKQPLLVEHRSVGWSAADQAAQGTTLGAIEFYEYNYMSGVNGSVPIGSRAFLVAEGVKRGTSGTKYYTHQILRDPSVPTNVLGELNYLDDSVAAAVNNAPPKPFSLTAWNALDQSQYKVTQWHVVRASEPADVPELERRVLVAIKLDPPRHLRPGSALYYPLDAKFYDPDDGSQIWSAVGMVRGLNPDLTPISDSAGLASIVYCYTYSADGRLQYQVVDAVSPYSGANQPPGLTINVPARASQALPAGWTRPQTNPPALQYLTAYKYDWQDVTDIYYPNGRRFARRTVDIYPQSDISNPPPAPVEPGASASDPWTNLAVDAEPFRRTYVFNDLELSAGNWVARSPGEVRDQISLNPYGPVVKSRKVEFVDGNGDDAPIAAAFLDSPTQVSQPGGVGYFRVVRKEEMRPDQYGRLTETRVFAADSNGVLQPVGSKLVNDLGEVYRERDLDGSVLRVVKNFLGQPLRRYVGTFDNKWTAANNDGEVPLSTVDYNNVGDPSNNNMVLSERYEYGVSPNDAMMTTAVRSYQTHPSWANYPYKQAIVPSVDPDGRATRTSYDWRMRPVREDRFSRGEPGASSTERLRTTLTYLDLASRSRLSLVVGPGALPSGFSAIDPSTFTPGGSLPTPQAILSLFGTAQNDARVLSLTERVLAADGTVEEARTYDVDRLHLNQTPTFVAEHNYHGLADVTTFAASPNGGFEVSTIDAVGRVASTATVLRRNASDYDFEISRTDNYYDADGNLVESDHWERVLNPASVSELNSFAGQLSVANAIRSATVMWYDVSRRLVATAELGAEGSSQFATPTSGSYPAAGLARGWHTDGSDRPAIHPGSGTITLTRGAAPADARLSVNYFDRKGNKTYTAVATGPAAAEFRATKYQYDGLGHPTLVVENVQLTTGDPARTETAYSYRFGQLAEVRASRTVASTTHIETTFLEFGEGSNGWWGADVVDLGSGTNYFKPVSRNASMVRKVLLPNPSSDSTSATTDPTFYFRYDFQGRQVERIDARRIAMRYTYDDLDRLKSIEVGYYDSNLTTFTPGYPANPTWLATPADRVAYVELAYADQMVPEVGTPDATFGPDTFEVRAWTAKTGGTLVTHTRMKMDDRGRLVADRQSIGSAIDPANTPTTTYTWDYTPATTAGDPGFHRLTQMQYPKAPGAQNRTVSVGYFPTDASSNPVRGLPSDVLSRIDSITTNLSNNPKVASFGYVGESRRAWMARANGRFSQNLGLDTTPGSDGIGLRGLDKYGQVVSEIHRSGAVGGSGTIIESLTYQYDLLGNRTLADRSPRPTGTISAPSFQRQQNTYDELSRLVTLSYSNYATSTSTPTVLANQSWQLDQLGNWANWARTDPDGSVTDSSFVFDNRNRFFTIAIQAGSSTTTTTYPRYDAAGNLAFDGGYYYQYDAFNRLVQINTASEPQSQGLNRGLGDPIDENNLIMGPMVRQYTYDGLGRLVRSVRPYPDLATADGNVRSEWYYYDGVRRVQEVFNDPLIVVGAAAMLGQPEAIAELENEPTLEEGSLPASVEVGQLTQSSGQVPSGYLEREYIWGPGDRGVDELLAEYSVNGRVMYPVMDAGGDLVATVEAPGTATTALPASKWTYDVYGRVLTSATYRTTPVQRVGHKGLFFDNLEGAATDPMLAVGATLVGHNRNRALLPNLGRFAQSDPRATGQAVVVSEAHSGSTTALSGTLPYSLADLLSDGPSIYAYCSGNPLTRHDVLGLSTGSDLREDAYEAFSFLSSANFDVPGPSTMMGAVLNALTSEYGQNLDWDVEWATDWSTGDDWHSRGNSDWIKLAIGRALASTFEFGIGDYKVGVSDLVGTASSGGSSRGTVARAIGRVADFSHRIVVNGKGANLFKNPRGGRKLVRFDLDAIKRFAKVLPTNSADEIRQANRKCGFPETPKGYVWHHHWKSGEMQLVPRGLHEAAGHIGRSAGEWPAPIPTPAR